MNIRGSRCGGALSVREPSVSVRTLTRGRNGSGGAGGSRRCSARRRRCAVGPALRALATRWAGGAGARARGRRPGRARRAALQCHRAGPLRRSRQGEPLGVLLRSGARARGDPSPSWSSKPAPYGGTVSSGRPSSSCPAVRSGVGGSSSACASPPRAARTSCCWWRTAPRPAGSRRSGATSWPTSATSSRRPSAAGAAGRGDHGRRATTPRRSAVSPSGCRASRSGSPGWSRRSSTCPGCRWRRPCTTPSCSPSMRSSTRPSTGAGWSPPPGRSSLVVSRRCRCEGLRRQRAAHHRGAQPGRQRHRVLTRRHPRRRRRPPRGRSGRDLGDRPGHRHRRCRPGPHLRALLPRRPGPLAGHGRHRTRPGHRQARLRQPRRRRHSSGARRVRARPSPCGCRTPSPCRSPADQTDRTVTTEAST